MSEFHDAVNAGDSAKVKTLLAADASLADGPDANGVSAIMNALYRGHREVAEVIAAGKQLDVFEAASLGRTERLQTLAAKDKAAVHAYSADGWTPLHLAAFFAQPAAVEWLLQNGADVTARGRNPMSNMPLHAAMVSCNEAVTKLLLAAGAPVNAQQHGGFTPMHAAAQRGNQAILKLLLAGGADTSIKTDAGETARAIAESKGHAKAAGML
jgi:ankyrin repeat protein